MRGSRPHTRCSGQATIPFSRGNDTCSSVNHTEEPQRRQPLGQAALGALIARVANVFYGIATSGGTLAYQKQAPTREAADKLLDGRLAAPFAADANDTLYQWDASRDYNPSPGLELIEAALLAINSADDERNPPETGIMERELKRVKNGKLYMIPASEETRGHGTTCMAKFWKEQLQEFVATAPRRPFMPGPQSAMHESKAA